MDASVFPSMLGGLLVAALIAWIAIPPIVRVSKKMHMVALPNGRTSHNGAVPNLGGIAIFAAASIGTSLFLQDGIPREFQFVFPALLVIFLVGLKDDLVDLAPRTRILAQVIAGFLIVVVADIRITSLFGMFGVWELPYLISMLFSLFVFVSLVNAFNLIDGIDGLASGLGIQASLAFGIGLMMLGMNDYAIMAFALAGSLITFSFFNVFGKTNKIFMGDTGSLLLGTVLATMAIKILCCPPATGHLLEMRALPAVVMAIMIVPIADTLKVFAIRISKGKSPFSADKSHFHHDLLAFNFSHLQASSIINLANLSVFGFALMFRDIHPLLLAVLVFVLGFMLVLAPRVIRPISNSGKVSEKGEVAYAK